MNRAKAISWEEMGGGGDAGWQSYEQEQRRLCVALQHEYLGEFDRGAIPQWALVQPHELLVCVFICVCVPVCLCLYLYMYAPCDCSILYTI